MRATVKLPALPPRVKRYAGRAAWFVGGAVVAALAVYVLAALHKPAESPWHEFVPEAEYTRKSDIATLDEYLALEDRLFDEVATWARDSSDATAAFDRYNTASPTWPGGFPTNWNRTFVLTPRDVRGGALLLHGLSDSPYSMRALGEIFESEGYLVVGLRIPFHGTVPGALRKADWRDWRAAVNLAAADLRRRIGDDAPLVLGGYSNGAALALEHTVAALHDDGLAVPDGLVFLSPAFTVTRMAAIARWQLLVSKLPGFDKLAWNSLHPEYDPYKYNSFALNAGWQIYRLTTHLEKQLARLEREQRVGELPPILSFTSVADATVPPLASLRRLFRRVADDDAEVVLFDVNRRSKTQAFLAPDSDAILSTVTDRPYPFAVTVVANRGATEELEARHRPAGSSTWTATPLGFSWPPSIYSLSHVALPFPPDDPIYGAVEPQPAPYPFGRLEPRGERGRLIVPITLLMRLRYNPFFPYIEDRVREWGHSALSSNSQAQPGNQGQSDEN